MKPAAIGVRAHSGWAALVALSGAPGTLEVLTRQRIAVTDPTMAGANQPYHYAEKLAIGAAERHLTECAAVGERLAGEALGLIINELRGRKYAVKGCAILLASGRALPPLPAILASHALIHTAEGEFFRHAFWKACERLQIPVTGVRERDLGVIDQEIAALGKSIGPPWTTDQKLASLAACTVL